MTVPRRAAASFNGGTIKANPSSPRRSLPLIGRPSGVLPLACGSRKRSLPPGRTGAKAAPQVSSTTTTRTTKAALMDSEAAAEFLKCSCWTLAAWRCKGSGRRFCKLGNRVRYALTDLEKWVEAHTTNSTSEHNQRKGKGE